MGVLVHVQNFRREPFHLFFSIDSYIYQYFFSFWVFYKYVCVKRKPRVYATEPPIIFFSKTLTNSASVGRAIHHLLLSRWTHPEKLLALLHFLGLYLNISFNNSDLCSNILQRIIVS